MLVFPRQILSTCAALAIAVMSGATQFQIAQAQIVEEPFTPTSRPRQVPAQPPADADDEPSAPRLTSDDNQGPKRSVDPMNVFDATPARDSQLVKDLLDANPGSELIICIAGCKGAGQPTIMLKRPSKISSLEVAGLLNPASIQPAPGTSTTNALSGDEVICLAGCIGPNGTIVFRGRQHAWIKPDGRDTLAAAMHELANRLLANSIQPASSSQRNWVSQSARENLIGIILTRAGGNLVVATTSVVIAE